MFNSLKGYRTYITLASLVIANVLDFLVPSVKEFGLSHPDYLPIINVAFPILAAYFRSKVSKL